MGEGCERRLGRMTNSVGMAEAGDIVHHKARAGKSGRRSCGGHLVNTKLCIELNLKYT